MTLDVEAELLDGGLSRLVAAELGNVLVHPLERRDLIEKGWPVGALLITVVRQRNGEGHAVLTVETDRGDLVLDSLQLGYRQAIGEDPQFAEALLNLGHTLMATGEEEEARQCWPVSISRAVLEPLGSPNAP